MNNYQFIKILPLLLISTLTSCIISSYNEPCSISGKVTDTKGMGIANVSIKSKSETFKDSIVTSSDGDFKIIFPVGGAVDLTFSKNGYTTKNTDMVLLGGEKKVLDIKLGTLSEDSYFNVGVKEKTISNRGETFSACISTNVNYEFESKVPWITCTRYDSQLLIKCDSNDTNEERRAIIIYRAEYNHIDSIIIKQIAGPVLRVLDYTGKNNNSFLQTKPFVTFSREISVISATGSSENLSFELSDDKKTVLFSNLKLNAFSSMLIQLTVMASDGTQLTHNLELKLYINSQSLPSQNLQEYFFTNDNKYVWVHTLSGSSHTLRQFSCEDFKEKSPIKLTESNKICYNPYNNSFYIVSQRYFEDRYVSDIKIYDAATSEFVSQVTIDNNGDNINDMEFSYTGYGLMNLGNKLYYIDSSNNHQWGLFSTSTNLYDPHQYGWLLARNIDMCNNNKTFVLYGESTSGTISVYTVSAETKELSRIFNSSGFHLVTTSNSGANALYYYENTKSIICQNVLDRTSKTLTLPSSTIRNTTLLTDDTSIPIILTSDFSIIFVKDNSILKFTHQGDCYLIKSSNDGKLVLVNYNNTAYLFKSDVFTKFNNYIK